MISNTEEIYDQTKLRVLRKQCDECLFSTNKIVTDHRKELLLREVQELNTFFVCHKSDGVCCRGFFDTRSTIVVRLAILLDVVELVKN